MYALGIFRSQTFKHFYCIAVLFQLEISPTFKEENFVDNIGGGKFLPESLSQLNRLSKILQVKMRAGNEKTGIYHRWRIGI
ncbi:hypothetical protein ES708_09245 [subsurface metagenome]